MAVIQVSPLPNPGQAKILIDCLLDYSRPEKFKFKMRRRKIKIISERKINFTIFYKLLEKILQPERFAHTYRFTN